MQNGTHKEFLFPEGWTNKSHGPVYNSAIASWTDPAGISFPWENYILITNSYTLEPDGVVVAATWPGVCAHHPHDWTAADLLMYGKYNGQSFSASTNMVVHGTMVHTKWQIVPEFTEDAQGNLTSARIRVSTVDENSIPPSEIFDPIKQRSPFMDIVPGGWKIEWFGVPDKDVKLNKFAPSSGGENLAWAAPSWSPYAWVTNDEYGYGQITGAFTNAEWEFFMVEGANSSGSNLYSSEVVGYIKKTIPPGSYIYCNPLSGQTINSNSADVIFRYSDDHVLPDGTIISKWTGSSYDVFYYEVGLYEWASNNWYHSDTTTPRSAPVLNPGEGFWLNHPVAAWTNIFYGRVVPYLGETNTLTTSAGSHLYGTPQPLSGPVTNSGWNIPDTVQLTISKWTGSGFVSYIKEEGTWYDGGFNPIAPPAFVPGEGFWMNPGDNTNWVQWFRPGQQ